jgi:ABC-type nitrate/sulfonate/bicarbonate transport system ATPase subunit
MTTNSAVTLRDFSILLKLPGDQCKTILHSVTVTVSKGSFFAILGGSGSGKTSLLSVIAGRYDHKVYSTDGSISITRGNDEAVGYVSQDDYLLPWTTVRETLYFVARMKYHDGTSQCACESSTGTHDLIVDDILEELGLHDCQHCLVGEDRTVLGPRGISGGEKRRLSISCQMISKPSIMCVDEPTSGLDAHAAFVLMRALQRLTSMGEGSSPPPSPRPGLSAHHHHHGPADKLTVICSIHQPRVEIFDMFESVLLLGPGGCPIYCGPSAHMLSHFTAMSYRCPLQSNPADFFIDLVHIDKRSAESERVSVVRLQRLVAAYRDDQVAWLEPKDASPTSASAPAPRPQSLFTTQLRLLVARFWLHDIRNLDHVVSLLLLFLVTGLVNASMYWHLALDSAQDVQSMTGLLYASQMDLYPLIVVLSIRYQKELVVFDKEYSDKLYGPVAYLSAHCISSTPMFAAMTVLKTLPTYYGSNLRPGNTHLTVFLAAMFLMVQIASVLTWMCAAPTRSFGLTAFLANTLWTAFTLAGGFLTNPGSLPAYADWVRLISPFYHSYTILMANEFAERNMGACVYHSCVKRMQATIC